ncbi:hypothetical protein HO133_003287 [Letharia lupina]|uniref:Uncharacterized protein n=1 Tax=Letharia lupina TaxID=560253 RepID=A0A8H6CBD2_9LECA|nr:uncharacterized protein HO133_003287 [Letharia lupina]KAF6220156.1 hypothetical protein HO133_003287 [Letharia lupina]
MGNQPKAGVGRLGLHGISDIESLLESRVLGSQRANDARRPSAETPRQGSEATAILSQRIGESASGLLKEFTRPSPKAVTGVLSSLRTDSAKAGSSSSSTDIDQSESFRSNEKVGKFGRGHGQAAFGLNGLEHESEFAQDGPAWNVDQQSAFSLGIGEDHLPRLQEKETWKTQDENQDFTHEDNDGIAVVALLSDPAFTMDEEPNSTLDMEKARGEEQKFERLQRRKGPARFVDALRSSNHLDLVPDFRAPWDLSNASLATQKGIHERGHLLLSKLGDVQPWIDIDRYHDEVWGDMLPLVHEAREELKAANENQSCLQDGPAIRRLKMVLQHLDNPHNR